MRKAISLMLVPTFLIAAQTVASSARAETVVVQSPPATTVRGETAPEETTGPSRGMLTSGAIMFGGTYVASLIVAGSSSHSGDNRLYVPILGPWLDLGDRGSCPVGSSACDNETTNKLLLVGDGVLQGLGAIQIVGAFLFPERHVARAHVAATRFTPEMTLSPARFGHGAYGLTASGSF